jgi:hypothetical protein
MHVIRRTPDAAAGDGYELQTLACKDCHHQMQRVVDREGHAPP